MFYNRVFFLLSLFLIGCVGAIHACPITSGELPQQKQGKLQSKSTNTLAMLVFENATEEPLLERQVASTFKELFIRRGFLVVSDAREADFILSGKIDHFEQGFLSLNTAGQASSSRVTIGLEYTLRGKETLKARLTASADYFNSADPAQDKAAQDRAVREASVRLSEKAADDIARFLTKG